MAKKKGKYAAVLDGLKPAPPEDASYQQQIDKAKTEFASMTAAQIAAKYTLLRLEHEVKKAEAALIYVKVEAAAQLLAQSQEKGDEGWGLYGAGENAIRLPNGDTIRVDEEPAPRVVDKEAFRLWCMAPADVCMTCGEREGAPWHDNPALHPNDAQVHEFHPGGGYETKMQLWPTTMASVAKERLLAGDPQPDGVEVNRYKKIVYTPHKEPVPLSRTAEVVQSMLEVE